MEILLKLLRALFARETSADQIFSGFDKIVRKAEAHVADQEASAAIEAEQAAKLQAKIDARKAEVAKTQKRAANVKKLMELAD